MRYDLIDYVVLLFFVIVIIFFSYTGYQIIQKEKILENKIFTVVQRNVNGDTIAVYDNVKNYKMVGRTANLEFIHEGRLKTISGTYTIEEVLK